MATAIRTVEWVYQNYSGCDPAEKVRNFIKDAYQYWGTLWVMMAGDVNTVPYRGAWYEYGELADNLPCDQYFSALEGTWNGNGNSLFGEEDNYKPMCLDMFFTGPSTGYQVSGKTVAKTTDSGIAWQSITTSTADLKAITFVSNYNGFVVGTAGTLLALSDAGKLWEKNIGTQVQLNDIFFLDPMDGWIVGNGGKIAHTTDGGINWNFIDAGSTANLTSICFASGGKGWIVGQNGTVLHTSDSGNTWQFQTSVTTRFLYDVHFINEYIGWISGQSGTLLHTIDGGQNWTAQVSGTGANLLRIRFADTLHGWVCGNVGTILYTADGGTHWSMQSQPVAGDILKAINVWDTTSAMIVGNRVMYRTSNGGMTWDKTFYSISNDNVDLYPEVFVTRAPVEGVTEARTWINKLLTYEKTPPTDYQNRMLFIGANLFGGNEGGALKDTIDVRYVPSLFDPITKLYAPGPNLNRENVIAALNQGYGIVNHADHSFPYCMGTGARTSGGNIYRTDVENLTNTTRPSVIYSIGCDPGAFDYDCIAEHFITANGGAVAFVGNSREGIGNGISDSYDERFFKAFLPDSLTQLGTAHTMAKVMLVGACIELNNAIEWCQYGLNAFGDPEMPIWTDLPKQLNVTHPSTIPIGANSVTITVRDQASSTPLVNALVCLQKGTEAYATACTDANGLATFNYTPETEGAFNITVTRQNYLPYQGTCAVVPTAKYICYDSNIIDDDDLGGTNGNGDGIANPGETVDLTVNIRNTGSQSVSGIIATITTNSPYIAPANFKLTRSSRVLPGQVAPCDGPCRFTVAPACPDYHRAVFHVDYSALGCTSSDSFVVTVMADSLKQTGHKLVELTGNGNGTIDPGETIQISNLETTNFGSGGAGGVTAELASTDPYITILDGTSALGAVAADGKAVDTDGFRFTVSSSAPAGRLYVFTLTLKDRFNRQWAQNDFRLVTPVAPTVLKASATVEGVELKWAAVIGAIGYHVYRADSPGGLYARLNKHAVKQASIYIDKDAQPQTQYYYVVTALDASANESGNSNEASLFNPLAYKPGWPVQAGVRGDNNWASAITGDIDGDGDKEVVLGANDGQLFVWHHQGVTASNNWSKSFGAARVSAALGDIDKCGLPEIIAGVGNASEFKIYAYKADGTSLTAQTIYTGANTNTESVISIGDIDRNGWLDILALCKNANILYDYEWTGAALNQKWAYSFSSGSPTGMAVGDINGDGFMEIVAGTWTGAGIVCAIKHDGAELWNVPLGSGVCSYPSIGDVNNDGNNEIVIVSGSNVSPQTCFVLNGSGISLSSFSAAGQIWGSLALGDIDRDANNDLEIVSGRTYNTDGLIAWHHDGTVVSGWPKNIGSVHSSPVIGDVNSDSKAEIIDGSDGKMIFGYKFNGQALAGFPIPTTDNTYSSPFIADLDGNGMAELGMDMQDGKIHAWEIPGTTDPAPDWPTSRHDAMNSGRYGWLNEFSGSITRNLAISGDNYFNGDVVVEPGVTLTVKSGARLFFTAGRDVKNAGVYGDRSELIVKGNLIAQGTASDSVRFGSWAITPGPDDWQGICMESGGAVQLSYCVIENARTGLETNGGSPHVSNSRIGKCGYGVIAHGGTLNVQNSAFVNNTQSGIRCFDLSASIANCVITGNHSKGNPAGYEKILRDSTQARKDSTILPGTGIYAYNCNVTLDKNNIANNYSGFQAGGSIAGTFTGNVVRDNVYQGFDLFGGSFNVLINGNTFSNNGGVFNWPWELAGISIGYRNLSSHSVIAIELNTFADNFAGARCTKYGAQSGSKLDVWLRHNDFGKGGNDVGFSMSCDVSSNARVTGVFNAFEGCKFYGVYVQNAEPGLINLGDVGNDFKGDDGGNTFCNNAAYDIYHSVNGPKMMKAEGNYWYEKDSRKIDARIYDDDENPACGPVDYKPYAIAGVLPVSETWSGVIPVAGDVVVPVNGKLTVEPGTTVRFFPNSDAVNSGSDAAKSELIINGNLEIKQKPGAAPVIFESASDAQRPGDWGGIICGYYGKQPEADGAAGGQPSGDKGVPVRYFKNVVIRDAVDGLTIGGGQQLVAENAAFTGNLIGLRACQLATVKNCVFAGNTVAGARFAGSATGIIESSVIKSNGAGVLFCDNANIICANNTIAENGTGMVCNDAASPDVMGSTFKDNINSGVRINGRANPVFSPYNSFIRNGQYHLLNYGPGNMAPKLNYWGTANADTIRKYIWDGTDSSGCGLVDFYPLWDGGVKTDEGGPAGSRGHEKHLVYELLQNCPNPMKSQTSIAYAIPRPGSVGISIYSVTGQLVRTVLKQQQQPGKYNVVWDGKTDSGSQTGAGVYFYRITADDYTCIRKMVVLR